MLIKLTQKDIKTFWNTIKKAIQEVCGKRDNLSENSYNIILSKLMSDEMQGWAFVENETIKMLVITIIQGNDIDFGINLTIYCVYSTEELDIKTMGKSLATIIRYAKNMDCTKVIAYTGSNKVQKLAEYFKASTEALLVWEL